MHILFFVENSYMTININEINDPILKKRYMLAIASKQLENAPDSQNLKRRNDEIRKQVAELLKSNMIEKD